MSTAVADVPVMFQPKSAVGKYAPYWENDQVMSAVMVRCIEKPSGEFFHIQLPDGETKWVHCHHLGVFR